MLFVVVPAYNEEKNISFVLENLKKELPGAVIVVVDDGSSDSTADVAGKFNVVVLRHKINRGQGAALETGTDYALNAGANHVVHFDADGQFDASDIMPALKKMEENGAEVALGSRFLDKTKAHDVPWTKRFIIFPVARIINFIFTQMWLTDVHNGFRIVKKNAMEKIKIKQDRMAHNSEIIKEIKRNNFKFIEVPISVSYKEYGQGIGGGISIIKDIILEKII